MVRLVLRQLRVSHYKKNLLVILPIISIPTQIVTDNIFTIAITFATFCTCASIIYSFNDVMDKDLDTTRNRTSSRPFASGALSYRLLKVLLFILTSTLILLCTLLYFLNYQIIFILFAYLSINIFYSLFRIKKKSNILGIFFVALGFPLRFSAGCIALDLDISSWGVTILFALAMFLLSGKRYQDGEIVETLSDKFNRVSSTNLFWAMSMLIWGASVLVLYGGFMANSEKISYWGETNLLFSIIFLVLGILRYTELAVSNLMSSYSSITEDFLHDKLIYFSATLFCITLLIGRV